MKPLALLPLALFVSAQTSAHAQVKPGSASHRATRPATAGTSGPRGCIHVGELSAKIPALPKAASCPQALYTVSRLPTIKLDYVSPEANEEALRETFGIESSSVTLAYVDTKIGTGPLALPNKYYSILYTGYLADGTEFDSSAKHGGEPITIPYGKHGVILGWDTGFDGMHVGGKRRLFIPYELAYGAAGHPPAIPAKANLIFDVELVSQSDTPPAPKTSLTPPDSPTPPASSAPSKPALAAPTSTAPAPASKPSTTPAAAAASPARTTSPAAATPSAATPASGAKAQ